MHLRLTRLWLSTAIGLAAAGLWLVLLAPAPALSAASGWSVSAGNRAQPSAPAGALFTATSAADFPDATPGDGKCETVPGNGICTLRAAIQEADVLSGTDTIQLLPNTTYLLDRPGADDAHATALTGDLDI